MFDGLAFDGARAVKGLRAVGSARDEPASGRRQTPAAALDPADGSGHAPDPALASAGVATPRSPSTCWRLSWLSIAHLSRAGLMSMPSRSSRSSARIAATSSTGLPLISSVRRLALAWLIAQPRPVNPTRSTIAVLDPEHQRDPVAAQRVGALVRGVGILDDPEIVGPSIVLEDVVAVEVVHAHSSVARASQFRPYRSDIDSCTYSWAHGGWYDPHGPGGGTRRYRRTDPWQR